MADVDIAVQRMQGMVRTHGAAVRVGEVDARLAALGHRASNAAGASVNPWLKRAAAWGSAAKIEGPEPELRP